MARKFSVSIQCDIDCVATKEEEEIIKKIENIKCISDEADELYDELMEKLKGIVAARLNEKNCEFFDVCDIIWD